MSENLSKKLENLKKYLASLESCAIAFSGGVDSTFLLKVASEVLKDKCVALTVSSALIPGSELSDAKIFAESLGVRYLVLDVDELATPGFQENPPERCYLCKKNIFSQIIAHAQEQGMAYVCEGSNVDDESDYRPGMRAIAELGVKSPLREARLTKAEIRVLSKDYDLPTWSKPSYACLASRIPYGETITREKLKLVEVAESYLHALGFEQVRVRLHGNLARLELTEEDYEKIFDKDLREKIHTHLKSIGIAYISVDLLPYKTGRMNQF
ncbi:MAG: ATP-dependent sacrificial sulfur transferase LarE [Phascolarctobacterium sp.]|nr:ATP-dependent sacrificial sulfur transferase LarE [Phascolarctobacterium sp.]